MLPTISEFEICNALFCKGDIYDPLLARGDARCGGTIFLNAADHVSRIFIANARQNAAQLSSALIAQFDQRQANIGPHQTKQSQGLFHRNGIALPKKRCGQLRNRPR